MKKIFCGTVVLFLILMAFAGCNSNSNLELTAKEGEPANGFVWENNYSEITITGYVGSSNDIVIPEKINGKPVTLIAKDAFSNFSGMKSLRIPGSIKKIDGAFQNCTSLETIELSEGIESLNNAFVGCTSIKKVVLPNSTKEIKGSFKNCNALQETNIPKSVTIIDNAFEDCTALKTVTIEEGITDLDYAFVGCSNLESVVIPNGVKSLRSTFENCTLLKTVNLPDGLESLNRTFVNCKSLEKVIVPESVTSISEAFKNCVSLKTLTIPESAGEYMYDAFSGCTSLETLSLPDSYKDEVRIDGLTNLKKITMSEESLYASLEEIELESIWSVVTDTNNEAYKTLKAYHDNSSWRSAGDEKIYIGDDRYCYHYFWPNDDSDHHYAGKIEFSVTKTSQEIYYGAYELINYGSYGGYTDWRYGEWCVIKELRSSEFVFEVRNEVKTDEYGNYIYDADGNPEYKFTYNNEVEVNGQMVTIQQYDPYY